MLRTCLYVGVIAGFLTALTGWAIYRVRGWTAGPTRRLVIGAGAMLAATLTLLLVADERSAVGPGGGAILWAESPVGLAAPASLLLLVAALRAAATTAAVAAGGCGGVFVPFLAIGDLAGRSFAPTSASPATSPAPRVRPPASPAATACRGRPSPWSSASAGPASR